jgi:hypothetical protein
MTIRHVIAAIICTLLCQGAESQAWKNSVQASNTVWIHFDGKWSRAPRDIGPPGLRDAPVTVITFERNGRLSIVQCWISTYDGGKYRISAGNPYRVFSGDWTDVQGRRRIVYRLKNVEHSQLPNDTEKVFQFDSVIRETVLRFDRKTYRPPKREITNLAEFQPTDP